MKKIKIIPGIMVIITVMINTLLALPQNSDVQIEDVDQMKGNMIFKEFLINAPQTDTYFAAFWLLPARYSDNSYTKFYVYVNNEYSGRITTSSGNWQSARIDGNKKIQLSEGTNVISIGTFYPECPEIETMDISLSDKDLNISSDAYDDFCSAAAFGKNYDVPFEEDDGITTLSSTYSENEVVVFSDVPLKYTFFKTFSFKKGEKIFITSSSKAEHDIDIFFYGNNPDITLFPDKTEISESCHAPTYKSNIGTTIEPVYRKAIDLCTPASRLEYQCLNWKRPSEKVINSDTQTATFRLRIPQDGVYLIRLRSRSNGNMAVADLNINGRFYYDDVPVTYTAVNYPAMANKRHSILATNCQYADDDPFLYVHGAKADRIVQINDDKSYDLEDYVLKTWDSMISDIFILEPTCISIENRNTLRPESKCDIIITDSPKRIEAETMHDSDSMHLGRLTNQDHDGAECLIQVKTSADGQIKIDSDENIKRISVYDVSGTCLGINEGGSHRMTMNSDELCLNRQGIYVIVIQANNYVTTKKIAVK